MDKTNKLLNDVTDGFDYLTPEDKLDIILEYHGLEYLLDNFFDTLCQDESIDNLKYILKLVHKKQKSIALKNSKLVL